MRYSQQQQQDARYNNGYFTKDDLIYASLMEPNYRCPKDQAEQILYALLKEGQMIEIELGKYKPKPNQEEEAFKR